LLDHISRLADEVGGRFFRREIPGIDLLSIFVKLACCR
jgi:hypothetical protein